MNTGMPTSILSVLVQAKGIAQTNTKLATTQGTLEKTAKAGHRMGRGIETGLKIGAGAAAVAIGAAVKVGMDFERQLSSLGAVSGASGKQMEVLERQALKLGESTAFTAKEVGVAQTELAKGGLSVKQIYGGGVQASLSLAAAGELELGEAAETTVNAMKLFGLGAKDASQIADMLATAANRTTADVTDFAMALKQGGSVTKLAGYDMNETVTVLESLAEAGIKNSDAGTSMKAAVIQLLKPSEKQAKLAKELGINWETQNGELKSAAGLSKELRIATDGMTKTERAKTLATLAGTDGVRTLNALYAETPAHLRVLEQANEKQGTAQEVATKKMDNFQGTLEQLQGAAETLGIRVYQSLKPALQGATEDATDLVSQISSIFDDQNLSNEEKFLKSLELVTDKAVDVVAKIYPQVVERGIAIAGKAGPKFIGALVRGMMSAWTQMDVLGKLFSVGLLIRAVGGKGAITAAGAAVGRWLGIGIGAGASAGIAGSTATSGAAGSAGGILAGLKRINWTRVGVLGIGLALADNVVSEFQRRSDERSPDLRKALDSMAHKKGPVAFVEENIVGPYITNALGSNNGTRSDRSMASNLLAQYDEMANKRVKISEATESSLRLQASELDLTKQQRVQLERMFDLMRAGRKLNVKVGIGLDPKKLGLITKGFDLLRSGVLTSMKDINTVVERNSANIASTLGTKSKEGRDKLAENYRDAAIAVGKAMANGDISIKRGLAYQKELFRNANLISGDDPLGIARGFRESWKKAGGINAQQRKNAIADLGKMPAAARQKAYDAMVHYGQGLVKGGKIPKQDLRDFKSAVLAQFSEMKTGSTQSSLDLAIGISKNFGSMGAAVGNVLQIVGENTNNSLTAFGAKPLTFAIKALTGWLSGGKEQKKQTGGFIVPGTGSGDRPGFTGEVGAFVLNREATRAYGFNRGGAVPLALEPGERYFTRHEVKAMGGTGKLEAMNRSVRRFQKGGEIGRSTATPTISGPAGPLLDIGQSATSTVADAAEAFVKRHRPKPAAGATGPARGPAGTSTYMGVLMATWVRLALEYAAAHGSGNPQPTSGYRSHAQNVAEGRNYFSEHEKTQYPGGAIDFGGPTTGLAQKMAVVDATRGFKYPLLAPIGFRDDGHASGTGHQIGGLVEALRNGGKVPGRESGDFGIQFQQRLSRIWSAAAPFFGPGATMPRTWAAGALPGGRAHTSHYDDGSIASYLGRSSAKEILEELSPGEETLVHEWAHAFQHDVNKKLKSGRSWEVEGGAEAFARWAAPQIYGKAGIYYRNSEAPMGYPGRAQKAISDKGWDWIEHGQFGFTDGGLVRALARGGGIKGPWAGSSIDKTYPVSDGYSGATLPSYAIEAVAEWAGAPGMTMRQITEGESMGHPGMDISDPPGHSKGLYAINDHYNPQYASSAEMRNPILTSLAASSLAKAAGGPNSNIWHGSSHVTGWDLHYNGDVEAVAKHLGGQGGGELSAGQQKLAEGKKRKANSEKHLASLEREVREAQSLPAKQSKLWRLIKFWGRAGIFDKDEHAHIIEAVTNAASQTKPQGAVNVLSGLADYAKGHGEITGQDPSNFQDLSKAIERAQDRGQEQRKRAVERQKRHVEGVHKRVEGKITKRAAFENIVARLTGLRRGADLGEEYASQLITLEPENLGDGYVGLERGAYGDELNRLLGWRNAVVGARSFASEEIGRFEQQIADIEALKIGVGAGTPAKGGKLLGGLVEHLAKGGKAGLGKGKSTAPKPKGGAPASNTFDAYKKSAYKIPLLEQAIADAKTMRDETWVGELEEIQGMSGPAGVLASLPSEPTAGAFGGRIFEIQNSIRELGLKVSGASSEGSTELKELEAQLNTDWHKRFVVSEAQRNTIAQFDASYPLGKFAGTFATGGSIAAGQWGVAGETGQAEIVQGPARVYSPSESEALASGGGDVTVLINGDVVQDPGDTRDPVEVLMGSRKAKDFIVKTAREGRAIGRRTPGGAR